MRKIIIFFGLFILCGTTCVAQNKYEKLLKSANYANRQYSVPFIGKKTIGSENFNIHKYTVKSTKDKNDKSKFISGGEVTSDKKLKSENKETKISRVEIWFGIILIFFIIITLYLLYCYARLKDVVIQIRDNINNKNESNCQETLTTLKQKISLLQNKIEKLELRANEDVAQKHTIVSPAESQPAMIAKYLRGKSKDIFSSISDTSGDSFFRLVSETGDMAEFEYCGNLEDARSQFNAIFDYVCDIEGSAEKAKYVKTTKLGRVKRIDGGWRVIDKATIRFE